MVDALCVLSKKQSVRGKFFNHLFYKLYDFGVHFEIYGAAAYDPSQINYFVWNKGSGVQSFPYKCFSIIWEEGFSFS